MGVNQTNNPLIKSKKVTAPAPTVAFILGFIEPTLIKICVDGRVGNKGQASCPFNVCGQRSLMESTISRNSPGNDFPTFGDKKAKNLGIFIIEFVVFIGAKTANFFSRKGFLFS